MDIRKQGSATALLHRMDAVDYADEAEDVALNAAGPSDVVAAVKRRTPMVVFVYVLIAATANALFGFEQSVISQAKIEFSADFNISTTSIEYGFLASGNPIGATVGAASAGFLQGPIGRRFTLIFACLIYIGAVLVSYWSTGFAMLAWGRLQTGLAIGLFSSTGPMYIAELSPPSIRGKLVTCNQIAICTGILLGFVVDKLLVPQWRLMFVAGLPLAVLLLLSFIFITPFSPRWLMTKGREEEARAVLRNIRGATVHGLPHRGIEAEVEVELDGIRSAVDAAAKSSPYEVMKEPWVKKAVLVGITLAFIQQWSGVNTVNSYAPDVLKDAGFNASDSLTQSIYIGVVKLIFVVVALLMMDRFGRRDMLLGGTLFMTISLVLLGTFLTTKAVPILSAVSLFLYMGAFELSLGPVMWTMLSEMYPLSVRGPAMAIGSTACWIFTVTVTFTFPPLVGAIGAANTFFLFTGVCGLSLIWQYYYVPETRGKSLEEIETMLKEGRIK